MKRLVAILLVLLTAGIVWAAEPISGRLDGTGRKQSVNVGPSGQIRIEPLSGGAAFLIQESLTLETFETTTGWTALNNDCTGLTTDLDHVMGAKSLEIDKVDGTANTIFAVIQKAQSSVDLTNYVQNGGAIGISFNVSDVSDIAYCLVRMGTSAAHYNEWRLDDSDMVTGWQMALLPVFEPSTAGTTGNGANLASIDYLAVGCAFDAQDDTLADIRIDNLFMVSGVQSVDKQAVDALDRIVIATEDVSKWGEFHGTAVGYEGPLTIMEARTSRPSAISNGEAVRAAANAYGEAIIAGYVWLTNSLRTEEIDPLSQHFVSGPAIVDRTNITCATDHVYFDMAGYRYFTFQIIADGVPVDTITITVRVTAQDDGTAPNACTYFPATNALYGVASWVDTADYPIHPNPIGVKYVDIQYVTAGGNNDQNLTIFLKRFW